MFILSQECFPPRSSCGRESLTWVAVRLTGHRRVGTPEVARFASMQQTVKIFTVEALLSHGELDH